MGTKNAHLKVYPKTAQSFESPLHHRKVGLATHYNTDKNFFHFVFLHEEDATKPTHYADKRAEPYVAQLMLTQNETGRAYYATKQHRKAEPSCGVEMKYCREGKQSSHTTAC